jgi:hypothetical protein
MNTDRSGRRAMTTANRSNPVMRWNCSLVYWAALVGVMQQRIRLAPPPDRHDQGIGDELRCHLCQPSGDPDAPFGRGEQHHAAIGGDASTIESSSQFLPEGMSRFLLKLSKPALLGWDATLRRFAVQERV